VNCPLTLPAVPRWTVWSALFVFALAGQALADATISGTLTIRSGATLGGTAHVAATSAKYEVYRTDAADDGTYSLTGVAPGTYTIAVIAGGLEAPDVTNVVVADGKTVTQDFALDTAKPFGIVKSTTRIPLTDDINSASFADAPLIHLDSGKNVGVGDPLAWGAQGGPNLVSGLFRLKYSAYGFHIAGDVTFKTPLLNNFTGQNTWQGNCLEFSFLNAPYDPTTTDVDPTDRWKLDVGLGAQTEWSEGINYMDYPKVAIGGNILRNPKDITKGPGGELVRIDIPWAVFAQGTAAGGGDVNGPPTPIPADNALGAFDIMLDAADPNTVPSTDAGRAWQLTWSGQPNWTPYMLKPVQFVTQTTPAGQ
jgi:hypothetical protein